MNAAMVQTDMQSSAGAALPIYVQRVLLLGVAVAIALVIAGTVLTDLTVSCRKLSPGFHNPTRDL